MKLFTELCTLAALVVTVTAAAADGLDDKVVTESLSAPTDEVMALVWLGKSLLAELTSAVAALWTISTCDFQALVPLLTFKVFSPLTALWRLLRSVQ